MNHFENARVKTSFCSPNPRGAAGFFHWTPLGCKCTTWLNGNEASRQPVQSRDPEIDDLKHAFSGTWDSL
jgi:hypothetical protein